MSGAAMARTTMAQTTMAPARRLAPAAMPGLMDALYAHLAGVAARGEPCPTGEQLGAAIGVREVSVAWLLRRLADERRIALAWETVAAGSGSVWRHRIVTLLASGARTARRRPEARPEAPDLLEQAKTFLRSRGPIVYAARIAHGPSAGDLIVVDNRLLTPAELIERARALGFAGA